MKFLNFFKTTLGITILILAVLAIIIIAYHWDTIKAWWNDETPAPGAGTRTANPTQTCIRLGGDQCSYLGLAIPCSECRRRGIPIK